MKTKEGNYFLYKKQNINSNSVDELNNKLEKINVIPVENLHIRCFRQLHNGSVWLSSDENFLGEIKNNAVEWKQRPANLPADFTIATFIEIGKQRLLTGGDKGLAIIDVEKNRATLFPQLYNTSVRCLYTDSSGTTFIGTYGKGYYSLYNNKLIALPLDANHYLAAAHTFLEDKNGFLWISTNRGLFQVLLKDIYDYMNGKMQSLYYYYYDNTAGFLTNEFNGGCVPSGIQLGDGKFSLPSMKGLVQFNPDSLEPLLPVSKIYIDGITADTAFINYNNNEIKISYRTNRLQFFISSPYFGNSYNQSIEYKLQKLDKNWYALNGNGIIEFNKLKKGNYSLELRKKAGFGKDNYITQTVAFKVEPAFYKTVIFKILLLCCIAALMYALYRFRLNYLINQKNKLEKEVFERTREQHALIDNLETVITDLEQSKEAEPKSCF